MNQPIPILENDVLAAISPEMMQYQRAAVSPQHMVSQSDIKRINDDTLTNMTGSTPLATQDPEAAKDSDLDTNPEGSDIRDKSIIGNDRIGLDLGVTHSESAVVTGAIAIVPGFNVKRRSNMAQKKVVNEWSPEFVSGGYKPGDPKMPNHGGKGLAGRNASELNVGKKDTELSDHGEPFGKKRNKNIAMAVANDQGVVTDPQGEHKSAHADPLADDCCDQVGHDWPDDPKHSGGITEPVAGHSYGPAAIKGGQVASESWSVDNFAKMIGEDADLQALFDNYARTVPHVCREDFQTIVSANGFDVMIDDVGLNTLMAKNGEFVFYANEDANGAYYTPISEMTSTAGVGFADSTDASEEESDDAEDAFLKKFVKGQKDRTEGMVGESVTKFISKAKAIIENAQKSAKVKKTLAESLNKLWDAEVGAVNVDALSHKLRKSIALIQKNVADFAPLSESEGMNSPTGTGLKGGDGPKVNLPDQPDEFKELDSKEDLIKRKPVNTLEKTPVVHGTGKGMTAESVVRKNIERIVTRVNGKLAESKLPKYDDVTYTVTLSEGKKGKARKSVAEAAADAEEALQIFEPKQVGIQAIFSNAAGSVLMKKDIPLFTIDTRGAFVTEGKVLFRHKTFAESYANALFNKGFATKLTPHNWGFAVTSNAPKNIVESWAPEGVEGEEEGEEHCGYASPEPAGKKVSPFLAKMGYECGYAADEKLPEEIHVDILSHGDEEDEEDCGA